MTRFALQPRWLAWHLLLVVVLVSFGWLGRWQLGAFEHKDGDRRPVAGVAGLDRLSDPGGRLADGDVGRRVRAEGRYDERRTLLVPGRSRPGGGADGYLVVAMLRTATGVLPVVRGWVPARDAAAVAPPGGPVRVTGLLQRSEDGPPPGSAAPTRTGDLPYVATVTLLDATPYRATELYDGYLALRTEAPATADRPVPVAAEAARHGGVGRWRNLAYALQWWLFAGAAVFFWWAVLRRSYREQVERAALQQQPPQPPDGSPAPQLAPPRTT